MANWNALRWSEQVRTGARSARHALTMLCLKCDDSGLVYRDAQGVADLCEMSTRTYKTWRDYLAEHQFIIVIRRTRRDGKEGKPLTLVNYPEAPHLNGQAIRLDYNGWHLFPEEPEKLRAAGLSWIAGDEINGLHPSAKPARGPRAKPARGTTSGDMTHSQVSPSAKPARGPRAKPAPPGGDSFCTPQTVPTEADTQPASASTNDKSTPPECDEGSGWLGSASHEETEMEKQAASDGARLLQSLRAADGTSLNAEAVTRYRYTVDNLLDEGNTEQQLADHLTTGMRGAGGIRSKLVKLANGAETLPAAGESGPSGGGAGHTPWCRDVTCEPTSRLREAEDGTPYHCPDCHPKHAGGTARTASHPEQASDMDWDGLLAAALRTAAATG